jgi:hypothetical protein
VPRGLTTKNSAPRSQDTHLQKQIAVITRYAEVGKTKSFDYDFPFLGEIRRDQESVSNAAKQIEHAKNKVLYSLFWFVNNHHIDKFALNLLTKGEIQPAVDTWGKLLEKNTVTTISYSAALNISTLQLRLITRNGSFDIDQFKKCIDLKGQVFSSDIFIDFVRTVAGENTIVNKDTISKEFVDEVILIVNPFLNKKNGITSKQLIDSFSSFPSETQQYVSSKFTDKPLIDIENQVEQTKNKRVKNAQYADQYGTELYEKTKADLKFLADMLGKSNVKYQVLVNNVAQEILQCSIDYFCEYRDSSNDPGEKAMKLMKLAKHLSPNGIAKNRVDENIENLQEWINNKPIRESQLKIEVDLLFITEKLNRFQNLVNSVANAYDLAVSCKPKLDNIKNILGRTDEFYIKISSAVVSNVQEMIVLIVNKEQKDFQILQRSSRNSALNRLKTIIQASIKVLSSLKSFDMDTTLRYRYESNMFTLSSILQDISKSSGGCYIATMIYGDYEHPQVLILREFRDNILDKTYLGKQFIKIYYYYSPKLVVKLQNRKIINKVIRKILNQFINIIK